MKVKDKIFIHLYLFKKKLSLKIKFIQSFFYANYLNNNKLSTFSYQPTIINFKTFIIIQFIEIFIY